MSTELRMIKGFHAKEGDILPRKADVTVRFTSDKYGETLSLEDGKTIIGAPFEDVEKLIKKARKNK